MKKKNEKPSKLDKKLIEAILNDNLKEVKSLVEMGANVNTITKNGVTPLMLAVTAPNNKYDMMVYLLKNGADALAKDENLKTAFDHIIEPPKPPEHHENAYEAWIYCEEHYMMNYIGDFIRDSFFIAIEEGDLEEVQRFIDNGVNTNNEYYGKETPLMRAMKAKKNKFLITKLLVENRADIFIKNYKNKTALELLIIPSEPLNEDKEAYENWINCDECLVMKYLNEIIRKTNDEETNLNTKSSSQSLSRPSNPSN